jgi:hypothetical protein
MNEILPEILAGTATLVIGMILGALLGEPLKRLGKRLSDRRERSRRIRARTRARPRFRVTQLCDSASLFDYSSMFKEQNHLQNLVQFDVDDFRRIPLPEELEELGGIESKRSFLERVACILAHDRGEVWQGLGDAPPDSDDVRPKDLVVTNIPLPGNFYAWNSRDRRFLLVSTAPVSDLFPSAGGANLGDFVERIAQRLTVFALVPELDPSELHLELAGGCLFDFNVLLRSVVDVVERPGLCPECGRVIAKSRGGAFYEGVTRWIRADRI